MWVIFGFRSKVTSIDLGFTVSVSAEMTLDSCSSGSDGFFGGLGVVLGNFRFLTTTDGGLARQ